MADLTHFDGQGAAHMVDVSEKPPHPELPKPCVTLKWRKKLMISLLKIALKKAMF